MKAIVDKDVCTGCGLCVETCPDVFKMDADGKAIVQVGEIPSDSKSCAKEAESGCPVEAIKVEGNGI